MKMDDLGIWILLNNLIIYVSILSPGNKHSCIGIWCNSKITIVSSIILCELLFFFHSNAGYFYRNKITWSSWIFSSVAGALELRRGPQEPSPVSWGKARLHASCSMASWDSLNFTFSLKNCMCSFKKLLFEFWGKKTCLWMNLLWLN